MTTYSSCCMLVMFVLLVELMDQHSQDVANIVFPS